MVFSDLFFLFVFIPAFTLSYLIASIADKHIGHKTKESGYHAKNFILILFSLIFYAWGEPIYVFLMILCALFNYIFGIMIDRSFRRRFALITGLVFNIIILCTFKYLGFFAQTINGLGFNVHVPDIALPIGISFYIFQSISYLVDVYRKESPAQRHFPGLLLYISMFPQLIAGPIVRYGTVAAEINSRHASSADIAYGIYRFFRGLGKKVIIANQLSSISSQFLDSQTDQLSTIGAWVGISAFTLQIYFDFSGYSDMAIGMGRCLGFHFNENFSHPYCSRSITEFWRRWHISLGSFFRDYVYIPMGGNRNHQAINIMTVWFLTGMWHGASWNFIIWGIYFGCIVMFEKYTLLKVHHKIPSTILHIYSLLLIIIGWGIFYFDDFNRMTTFFKAVTGWSGLYTDFAACSSLTDNFWLWITAILLCMPLRSEISALFSTATRGCPTVGTCMATTGKIILSITLLVLSVALLVGATNNAFIYTRF